MPARESVTHRRLRSNRSYFLASKLAELGPQPYVPPSADNGSTNSGGPLLLLPCPSLSSPLTPTTLLPLLSNLPPISTQPITISASILLPSETALPALSSISVPLRTIGVMLYLSVAHYESGLTPLAAWIPCQVEEGKEGSEGVRRFGELVEEWKRRGGEADGTME